MSLHIGIAGPIASVDVAPYLGAAAADLPVGYPGAPLMGVLIGEMLRRGHRVSAFTVSAEIPLGRREALRFRGDGFALYVSPVRRRAWRPNGWRLGRIVDFFAYERSRLRAAMEQAAPDVIHAHWAYEFALAALATGRPTLVTCHDVPAVVARHTRSPFRWLRGWMAREVYRRGRHFSTVSPYMRRQLEPEIGRPLSVVPNPIAPHILDRGGPRSAPRGRRVAMACNGWDRLKNPEAALRAFAAFRQRNPEAELHLFGHDFGPGQRAEHWAKAQEMAAGVSFRGSVGHQVLARELTKMDLLVHPSLEESFGVVVAEAMALGLPVIGGINSGAVPWVLGRDEDSPAAELLCEVSRRDAILDMLDRAFDERYGIRSRAGCRRVADNFAPAVVADAYLLDYERVMTEDTHRLRKTGAPRVGREIAS